MKATLRALVAQAIDALRAAGTLPADLDTPDFVIERPKNRAQGDFSTNAAMLLAKPARSNPRAIAQALLDAPNTSLLPHVGSASVHTREAMADLVADNLVSWFGSGRPLTPVPETAHVAAKQR